MQQAVLRWGQALGIEPERYEGRSKSRQTFLCCKNTKNKVQLYLATLFEFFESEFVIMVLVHLVKDLFHPFLWSVLVLVDWLLTL